MKYRKRFGDWEMDTIIRKNSRGANVTFLERPINNLLMEKLPEGKNAKAMAKVVSRLLFPFWGMAVRTLTTDNGCEYCVHEDISKILGNVPVFFANSYASWQKWAIENGNKLIRRYIQNGLTLKILHLYLSKNTGKTQRQTQT
ncbi:MAG: IS30 family transposase [Bacteroidaceae bacterium]|nr:IS30 family transposase [Bacteroidaceae bacterium]